MDLREKMRFSMDEIAEYLGISAEDVLKAEQGSNCFSLSQLESIANLYQIPLDRLINWDLKAKVFSDDQLNFVRKSTVLHDHILAARLKKARLEKQFSPEALAELCEITTEEYLQYENAEKFIPYPMLEEFAKFLSVDLVKSQVKKVPNTQPFKQPEKPRETSSLVNLPAALKEFVSKPINQPYIELARKLSEYDVNRLRKIAESLLEITY